MMITTLFLAAASVRECRVVTDDVIRMSDLAAASPVFSTIDADETVGYSPLPGAIRILTAAQLARLAHRNGIPDGEFHDVCFGRAMRQLTDKELLDACRTALAIPGADV